MGKRVLLGVICGIALAGAGAAIWVWNNPRPTVRKSKVDPPQRPLKAKNAEAPTLIVDSRMTRAQALGRNKFPPSAIRAMEVVTVTYWGFAGKKHQGQIVVDRRLAGEVKQIFRDLEAAEYPIEKVVPVVKYRWHDQSSVDDNNTSGFNYRTIEGPGIRSKKLSKHATGRAIDLNPYYNPFVSASGKSPRRYDPAHPATLTRTSRAVKIFKKYGWKWGGDWRGAKDYQHFEKP